MNGDPRETAPGATEGSGTAGPPESDRSIRLTVPSAMAEEAGAILMDMLGPFEEETVSADAQGPRPGGGSRERVVLVFYPPADGPATREELLALLPARFGDPGVLAVESESVSRDWVEGWRQHFRPIVIGEVRIRPPWEAPSSAETTPSASPGAAPRNARTGPVDVVINPGLGFGTGLHPTTRGALLLLQGGAAVAGAAETDRGDAAPDGGQGPLVDVGTGSGILAIAAAKLGWSPVLAFDSDPVALVSAKENVAENRVSVELREADVESAERKWFDDATVLANMTLEPISLLLKRLAGPTAGPRRVVVSGILAGSQEEQIMLAAHEAGFAPGRRLYEEEWVSFELFPDAAD